VVGPAAAQGVLVIEPHHLRTVPLAATVMHLDAPPKPPPLTPQVKVQGPEIHRWRAHVASRHGQRVFVVVLVVATEPLPPRRPRRAAQRHGRTVLPSRPGSRRGRTSVCRTGRSCAKRLQRELSEGACASIRRSVMRAMSSMKPRWSARRSTSIAGAAGSGTALSCQY
jgi:hypothetical protein